jgi:hypothetical protein
MMTRNASLATPMANRSLDRADRQIRLATQASASDSGLPKRTKSSRAWVSIVLSICICQLPCHVAMAQASDAETVYYGEVGINVDPPLADLHIKSAGGGDPTVYLQDGSATPFMFQYDNTNQKLFLGSANWQDHELVVIQPGTDFKVPNRLTVQNSTDTLPYFVISTSGASAQMQVGADPGGDFNLACDTPYTRIHFVNNARTTLATSDTFVWISPTSYTAIGYDAGDTTGLTETLNVKGSVKISGGSLAFDAIVTSPSQSGLIATAVADCQLFAAREDGRVVVFVRDNTSGIDSRLNSHADPRDVYPSAITSFGDPAVELPFSFQHRAHFLGKGAIVDMSKLIKYVEGKMQEELGEEAGRVTHVYDLPAEERMSSLELEELLIDRQLRAVRNEIDKLPWIKVETSGAIPDEAVEWVDEVRYDRKRVEVVEDELNFGTMRIVKRTRQKETFQPVLTGRKAGRLKSEWKFENGALYRRPKVTDPQVDRVIENMPQLAPWIHERLQQGAIAGESLMQSIEEIRALVAERLKPGVETQTSALSVPESVD